MAIAASAPVLPNQKKQCRKVPRFTDALCTSVCGDVAAAIIRVLIGYFNNCNFSKHD